SAGDARHGEDTPVQVVVDAGRFGVGTEGVFLHDPQVSTAVVEESFAVVHHTPVDAGHDQGHADEKTEAEAGEDELPPAVQDVATGETDHRTTPAMRSTSRIRLFERSAFSL